MVRFHVDYDSDDGEEEDEWPHPLGFSPSRFTAPTGACIRGLTRFRWPSDSDSDDDDDDENRDDSVRNDSFRLRTEQQFPPISTYADSSAAGTRALLEYPHQGPDSKVDVLQEVIDMFNRCLINDTHQTIETTKSRFEAGKHMQAVVDAYERKKVEVQRRAQQDKLNRAEEQSKIQEYLKTLLKRDKEAAENVERMERAQEEARKEAERLQQEKAAKIVAAQKKKEEQERLEKEQQAEAVRKAQEAEQRRKDEQKAEKEKQEKEQKEAAAKKMAYVAKAQKLIGQLKDLRASVEPFEKLKVPQVSKLRLQMKKIVRGKINTLSLDGNKVIEVASEVSAAIRDAKASDEQLKQQLQSGVEGVTREMARSERYFLDLLASNVIVRVQAESFGG